MQNVVCGLLIGGLSAGLEEFSILRVDTGSDAKPSASFNAFLTFQLRHPQETPKAQQSLGFYDWPNQQDICGEVVRTLDHPKATIFLLFSVQSGVEPDDTYDYHYDLCEVRPAKSP